MTQQVTTTTTTVGVIYKCKCKAAKRVDYSVTCRRVSWDHPEFGHCSQAYKSIEGVSGGREVRSNGFHFPAIDCQCGRSICGKEINGRFSADHVCGSKCTGATGPSCDCQCGGANHGSDHG